jgi:hypothetical protein
MSASDALALIEGITKVILYLKAANDGLADSMGKIQSK